MGKAPLRPRPTLAPVKSDVMLQAPAELAPLDARDVTIDMLQTNMRHRKLSIGYYYTLACYGSVSTTTASFPHCLSVFINLLFKAVPATLADS